MGTRHGAAKGATVIGVRVYDCTNAGPLSQALAGLNWISARLDEERARDPDAGGGPRRRSVVNLSFGGDRSPLLDDAVAHLVAAGAPVIVAAGACRIVWSLRPRAGHREGATGETIAGRVPTAASIFVAVDKDDALLSRRSGTWVAPRGGS